MLSFQRSQNLSTWKTCELVTSAPTCATKPFTAHGSSRCCMDSAPRPWSVQKCPKLKYNLSVDLNALLPHS